MTKRNIITVLLGTIILFIWNAVSWMGLPFHSNTLNNLPESSMNMEYLQTNQIPDGVYHYPGLPEGDSADDLKVIQNKLKTEPRITLMVYKNSPSELFDPTQFVRSLLLNLVTVVLLLLLITKLEQKTLKSIMLHCLTIGLLIGVVADLGQMNWYLFPLDYTLVNFFDRLIPFALLGFLFGAYTFKERQA